MRLKNIRNEDLKITVIGLGYVGLKLAIEINKNYKYVYGYDFADKIDNYNSGIFSVDTVLESEFNNADIIYTCKEKDILNSDVYIIAVDTPIDKNMKPDISFLIEAIVTVAKNIHLSTDDKKPIVCIESTISPGTTDGQCNNIISSIPLTRNEDYYLVYSPERINPGDKTHTLNTISKIVASDNEYARNKMAEIYSTFINAEAGAGIVLSTSIRAAEASKMFENIQRDVMIALSNQYSMFMDNIGVDFSEVYRLAKTRWNFLEFYPGLVGGHCIPVDPYYMISSAIDAKCHLSLIETSREINESMSTYIAYKIRSLVNRCIHKNPKDIKFAILGVAYKENVNDIRNSKIFRTVNILNSIGNYDDFVYCDTNVDPKTVKYEYGINLMQYKNLKDIDVLIIAVKHKEYIKEYSQYFRILNLNDESVPIVIDLCDAVIKNVDVDDIAIWKLY